MSINVISLTHWSRLTSPRSWSKALTPLLGLTVFLLLWHLLAGQVQTSLGTLPGPVQTGQQLMNLVQEHQRERDREQQFYQRQHDRNQALLAKNPEAEVRIRTFNGRPTFSTR
ncbi:hypothetical protein MBH78_02435 [Oceanimonas sp. NS1]|nr:hypothetical protein [Oceanimonas sp. NS1]